MKIFVLLNLLSALVFGCLGSPSHKILNIHDQPERFNLIGKREIAEDHPSNVILFLVNGIENVDKNYDSSIRSKNVQGCSTDSKSCSCNAMLNGMDALTSWAEKKGISTSALFDKRGFSYTSFVNPNFPANLRPSKKNEVEDITGLSKSADSTSSALGRVLSSDVSFAELIKLVVRKFESSGNDFGYLLFASTSAGEFPNAMNELSHHVSSDTLVIVTGMCSDDSNEVPILARGKGADRLMRDVKGVQDLPAALRDLLQSTYVTKKMLSRAYGAAENLYGDLDLPKVRKERQEAGDAAASSHINIPSNVPIFVASIILGMTTM